MTKKFEIVLKMPERTEAQGGQLNGIKETLKQLNPGFEIDEFYWDILQDQFTWKITATMEPIKNWL